MTTGDERPPSIEGPPPLGETPPVTPGAEPARDHEPQGDTATEYDDPVLNDALGDPMRPFFYVPGGNINSGSVHGGQRVYGGSGSEGRRQRQGRVREGQIPEAEARAAAFGFARPDWFDEAREKLENGPLFLAGRPGSGRRTAALNLLRASCGEDAPLRALDSVTELDRWRPGDTPARGYLMDGLFPSRPLSPGVLGHIRSLLDQAGARMVIVLPDDTALLWRLEQELHVSPTLCVPPTPGQVFGSYFEAVVPQRWERERLLAALSPRYELGDLLVPELVPSEVVELVTAIVAADGDPSRLGDLKARLSYRAEREVPGLVAELRDQPDALSFLLAACVYEGLDQRLVSEEADRLLKLAAGRLESALQATDTSGTGRTEKQPNPDFVFRRPVTELLNAVGAVRNAPEVHTGGEYAHSVESVTFVRHRQAESVLRHVWREYRPLSDLLVEWLREVHHTVELTRPAGQFMGRAATWGGGRRALRHIQALARSERTTSRLIAANALAIAAEDPVLVSEVRYRLREWSRAADARLRTMVAYTCGIEFGLSRPDLALRLLDTLFLGLRSHRSEEFPGEPQVLSAVRSALIRLFHAGNEAKVFHQVLEWLDNERCDSGQVLSLIGQLLHSSRWATGQLAELAPGSQEIIEAIRRALNTEVSFDNICSALLQWARWGRWDETLSRAVENLFSVLARSMRSGEFRLFVTLDETGGAGFAGLSIARKAIRQWRNGEQWEAA